MRMAARLVTMFGCVITMLSGEPAAALPMHCVVAGGSQTADSASVEIGRFEGDIDPETLIATGPAQWALSGGFDLFRHLGPRAVRHGRFVLIDVAMGGNPSLELVVDRRAPRAWIRAYVYPDDVVRVREWPATCDPLPDQTMLPPPPAALVPDGSPAPTSGPLLPHSLSKPLERRPWRPRIDPMAPAEVVKTATPP